METCQKLACGLAATGGGACLVLRRLPHLRLRRCRAPTLRAAASDTSLVATATAPAYTNGTAHARCSSANGALGANGDALATPVDVHAVQQAAATQPVAAVPAVADAAVAVFGAGVGGAVPVQAMFSPPETYQAVVAVGTSKAKLPSWQTFLLAIAAGCYTAMFCSLLLTVGPNSHGLAASNPGLARYLIGAIGLPFQLLIIKVCGAELFTGSTAQLTAALHEGRITLRQLLRQWACSYLGNALGCALGVALLLNSGVTANLTTGISAMSSYKVAIPLKEVILRAVLANWFVCLAVWQAHAAQSVGGKFIAILGPISAFIAVGFEHCIANMVIIPLGILTGVEGVTWSKFLLHNLLPVTLGNIFAGAVCVATLYSLAFGELGRRVNRALANATA